MDNNDGLWGAATALVVCFVVLAVVADMRRAERKQANQSCQSLGYSAGHYEKVAGLVCEQWIEAARVTK